MDRDEEFYQQRLITEHIRTALVLVEELSLDPGAALWAWGVFLQDLNQLQLDVWIKSTPYGEDEYYRDREELQLQRKLHLLDYHNRLRLNLFDVDNIINAVETKVRGRHSPYTCINTCQLEP